MYESLGAAIAAYRREHDIPMSEFAARAGMSKAYVGMLERGINYKTNRPIEPSWQIWKKSATAMGISLGELMELVPNAPVLLDNEDDSRVILDALVRSGNVSKLPSLSSVPRLGTIACREPILAEQNIDVYDQIPDYIKCDFTLVCKGDSMIDARIHDGDIVCIKQQDIVENGQIAAVLIGDEATLKRFYYEDGTVTLMPANHAYPPKTFSGEAVSNVRVLGLATHFISKVV